VGGVASIIGRFYAMDRDQRWERVERAYHALVHGVGEHASDATEGIRASYEADITDEFVLPTVTSADPGSRIQNGDTVVFFNFRSDRARELTRAFTETGFSGFDLGTDPPEVTFIGMTEYDASFTIPVAFPDVEPEHVLAQVLGEAGLTQLHIAETEKYAHVTFFFNGGRDEPYPGERRCLVASPTEVATYDEKPQMSAYGVAQRFEEIMNEEAIDFVVLNFANPDMVGHTGVLPATIEALGQWAQRILKGVGLLLTVGAGAGLAAWAARDPKGFRKPLGSVLRGQTIKDQPVELQFFDRLNELLKVHRLDNVTIGPIIVALHHLPLAR
jgi:2,3-bisphosphoglycerate-independent phosphoglycerate mutase